jgi:hypothetical protein
MANGSRASRNMPNIGIKFEELLWLKREVMLGGSVDFGPTATTSVYTEPLAYLRLNSTFSVLLDRYSYFSYDSLELRITLSSPKAIVGAAIVAVAPYQTFPSSPGIGGFDANFLAPYMSMRENSVLLPYGASEDAMIEVPWMFR